MPYDFRMVQPERADMHSLQCLIDSNDEYYDRITGYPPGLAESQTLRSARLRILTCPLQTRNV